MDIRASFSIMTYACAENLRQHLKKSCYKYLTAGGLEDSLKQNELLDFKLPE